MQFPQHLELRIGKGPAVNGEARRTGVVAAFATLAAFCVDNRLRHELTPRRSLAAFSNPARAVAGSDSAATTAL